MRFNISEGVTEGKFVTMSLKERCLNFAVFSERKTQFIEEWSVRVTLPHLPTLGVGVFELSVWEEHLDGLQEVREIGWFVGGGVVDDCGVVQGDDEFEQFPFGASPLEVGNLRRSALDGGEDSGIFEALLIVPDGVADELQAIAVKGRR